MQRFLAVLIDGFLVAVPYTVGMFEDAPEPVRVLGVFGAFALVIAQLVMVSKRGQTIGKRAMGIKIVLKDTLENGGFVVNVLKRGVVNGLICLIPGYFLVDSLFIFRADRRCLHDMIAGTLVVQC